MFDIIKYTIIISGLAGYTNSWASVTGESLCMNNCVLCYADDGSDALPGVVDLTENRNGLVF